jgi:hypothetical protein
MTEHGESFKSMYQLRAMTIVESGFASAIDTVLLHLKSI